MSYGHAGYLASLPSCPCGAVAKFADPDPICGRCYIAATEAAGVSR